MTLNVLFFVDAVQNSSRREIWNSTCRERAALVKYCVIHLTGSGCMAATCSTVQSHRAFLVMTADLISFQCIVIWAVLPWLISCLYLFCREYRILCTGYFVLHYTKPEIAASMGEIQSVKMSRSIFLAVALTPGLRPLESILKEQTPAVLWRQNNLKIYFHTLHSRFSHKGLVMSQSVELKSHLTLFWCL